MHDPQIQLELAISASRALLRHRLTSDQIDIVENTVFRHWRNAGLPLCAQLEDAHAYAREAHNAGRSAIMRMSYIHTSGMLNMLISKIMSSIAKHKSPAGSAEHVHGADTTLRDKVIASLKQTGYCIIPNIFNLSDLRDFSAALDGARYSDDSSRAFVEQSVLYKTQSADKIVHHPLLAAIADGYLRCRARFNMLTAWKTRPLEHHAETLSTDAMMWHYDHDHNSFLKVFIYLSDVGPRSGPHAYIPRSSRLHLPACIRRDGRYTDEELGQHVERARYITAPAGTVIFADTLNLHKGTPVFEGERRIVQLQYTDTFLGGSTMSDEAQRYILNVNSRARQ